MTLSKETKNKTLEEKEGRVFVEEYSGYRIYKNKHSDFIIVDKGLDVSYKTSLDYCHKWIDEGSFCYNQERKKWVK